jgi:hypothetical protein
MSTDRPVPPGYCWQCGGECRTFFADGSHLPPAPHTAAFDVVDWFLDKLTDAQAEDWVWLDALARHIMARSLRARWLAAGSEAERREIRATGNR